MRGWLLLVVAGCYQASPPANVPCGPGGECPTGQSCQAGRCTAGGIVPDDAPIVDDAPGDTPAIDAPPDAPPNLSGCADGQREAFETLASFPAIAGCAATWADAADLRAPATGTACGNDLGTCAVPADACAPGWHICGTAGQPTELSGRATEAECAAAGGQSTSRFVTAMSHCVDYCIYDLPLPCLASSSCSEPICCGAGCRNDAGCKAGAYAATLIAGSLTDGCGALLGTSATGVLCCE